MFCRHEAIICAGSGLQGAGYRDQSRTSKTYVFYAVLFRLLPQFLCPTVCVYGGTTVPRGAVRDRHLVTVPKGVVGDRLPWGGEGQGGGGYLILLGFLHRESYFFPDLSEA